MTQSRADLDAARINLEAGKYEWACFIAQQAAEKAVKAVFQALGGAARGHSVVKLLKALEPRVSIPTELLDPAARLDLLYVPTRYPNGLAEGAPAESFTRGVAEAAIDDATAILGFCDRHLVRPGEGPRGNP